MKLSFARPIEARQPRGGVSWTSFPLLNLIDLQDSHVMIPPIEDIDLQ